MTPRSTGRRAASPLGSPTAAIASAYPGSGYWTVTTGGQVSDFGGAPSFGSMVNASPGNPNTANPPQNVPPNPNFLSACYPHNTGPTCMAEVKQATAAARAS